MIPLLGQIARAQPDGPTLGDLSGVMVAGGRAARPPVQRGTPSREKRGSTSSPLNATNRSCATPSRPRSPRRTGPSPAHVTLDRGRDEIRSITTTAHVARLHSPAPTRPGDHTRRVDLHVNPLRKRNETVYGTLEPVPWIIGRGRGASS